MISIVPDSGEIAAEFRRGRGRNPARLYPLAAENSSQLDDGQATLNSAVGRRQQLESMPRSPTGFPVA
ncbi:hypothetical protein ZIOFF_032951 [Zingiber officinale]|uniref:Uncharacterized protein n=1 Tax=Zingiber officinale TaxID=94328 RepID=A0A8J5GJM0_ZINOF|nr:hypothetical protein ZIOFF_032951 [Zingiber officinale]